MNVVERKEPLIGMLEEEKGRCLLAAVALEKEIERLPRGVLLVRSKPYKDKVYRYHYRKFRQGKRSVSIHVPSADVESVRKQIESRLRYVEELRAYRSRIRFLEKALGQKGNRGR
jgi:hypothetical protein